MEYSQTQHEIWTHLVNQQLEPVKQYGCQDYLEGLNNLELKHDQIPSLDHLNERIEARTGWRVVRTGVRYSDAVQWYQSFARREFLVTDYMRGWDELEFTPEPDMFHDIFGHLPFMTLPRYTALQEMFAPAFHAAGPEQKEDIKRLAWFSTEFGLIHEDQKLKIFGAGLISSSAEMWNVMNGVTDIKPFTLENVLGRDKAIWSFNETLFVFESLESLKAELNRYFKTL